MSTPAPSPRISVLMPAYNHAPYVRTAVDSVLAQTWQDFELVIIDDASSDDTWAVLQAYADPRIRLQRHDANQGSHATLNDALNLARGEFIAILNSDDAFAPGRLAACLAELEASGADMVGTDIALIDDDGRPVVRHWWLDAFAALKDVWHEGRDWPATLLEGNVFMTTSNFFFRRRWRDTVGDFHALRYVLDYEWLLRGLARGLRLAWLDAPLLHYRLHESNTISERPLAANLECARMLREQMPELLAQNAAERVRLDHLASQWARIEKYLGEIAATQRHEALVAKEGELFPLIADRDRWIEERDQWLAERDERIRDQQRWIGERDQWIAERDQWIAERDQWIAERDARIGEIEPALAECRAELAAVRASRSYRLGRTLTAPLRWLREAMSRGGEP